MRVVHLGVLLGLGDGRETAALGRSLDQVYGWHFPRILILNSGNVETNYGDTFDVIKQLKVVDVLSQANE